jgi:adenylate kinase
MRGTLVEVVMAKIGQAARFRHRLVVVIAPFGEGKTHVMHAVAARTGAPLLDLCSVLSDRMRGLTEKQRQQQLSRLLGETVRRVEGDLVLLDGGETTFDPAGMHCSLDSLWKAARNKTVVLALQGAEGQSQVLLWRRKRTRRTRRQS